MGMQGSDRGHGRASIGRRAQRMGRGDVRPLLLVALLDGPAHGYEVIRRLEQRSGGAWRPSPGSVYPTLQLLEETELLIARDVDGKRVFELTDAGRAQAQQAADAGAGQWWEAAPRGKGDLRAAVGDLHVAARQVGEVADPGQLERAVAIVREARQRLYQLLAEE
jgi:DNA-binding PadR family transcriptional regulator